MIKLGIIVGRFVFYRSGDNVKWPYNIYAHYPVLVANVVIPPVLIIISYIYYYILLNIILVLIISFV